MIQNQHKVKISGFWEILVDKIETAQYCDHEYLEDAKKAWRVLFSFSFEQKCSSAAEFYAGSWRDAMLLLAERCKTSFAHWLQHLA